MMVKSYIVLPIVVAAIVLCRAQTVHATCEPLANGGERCCAGGDENSCYDIPPKEIPTTIKAFERANSTGWFNQFNVGLIAALGTSNSLGGELLVGRTLRVASATRTLNGSKGSFGALCAPFLCGFVGAGSIPRSALLGDEFGLSLGPRISQRNNATSVDVIVRPTARATISRRLQGASFLGALLPEFAIDTASDHDWSLTWYPLALGYFVSPRTRVALNLGVGFEVGDTTVSTRIASKVNLSREF